MMVRRMLAPVVLVALLTLTPVAYASPPDETWISGIYDNDDFDDVILVITGHLGAVAPDVVRLSRPLAYIVRLVVLVGTDAPTVPAPSSGPIRAPPLA